MSDAGLGAARVTDAQLRFLRAIADRVTVERVAELYLFPPMRQGHVESGVGVVAVLPEPESEPGVGEPAGLGSAASSDGSDLTEVARTSHHDSIAAPGDPGTSASDGSDAGDLFDLVVPEDATAADVANVATNSAADADANVIAPAGEAAVGPPPDNSMPPDDARHTTKTTLGGAESRVDSSRAGAPPQTHDTAADPGPVDHFAADRPRTPRTGGRRSTIFSARYRLTLKGPDRGKWEIDVRAEADAPLITVDAVIRGIQRRAPGEADAERLTGDTFRELIAPPA